MYYPHNIEELCYEEKHIEQVITEMKAHFHDYFELFIQSEAGTTLTAEEVKKLAEKFGSDGTIKSRNKDKGTALKNIIAEGIEKFEKDREAYSVLLDEEALEEYEDNPAGFKSALSKDCPIIRGTLNSPAKELDKYKYEFRRADPNVLLSVCQNLSSFAEEYAEECDGFDYDSIETLDDMEMKIVDTEDYSVFGVIGGGIKSQFLYKLQPAFFPYRSKEAIWALWYLTDKKTFECEEGSQFLMINVEKSLTNQNYFYPYELFSFYAFQIYLLIKKKAENCNVHISDEYRYVIVDQFFSFIAQTHEEDIKFISSSSEDKLYSWI